MKQTPWLGTQKDLMQGISFFEALPTTNFATWLFWKASEDKAVGQREVLLAACDVAKLALQFMPKDLPNELRSLIRSLDFAYGFLSPAGVMTSRFAIEEHMLSTWDIAIKHYYKKACAVGWALVGLHEAVGIAADKLPYHDLWLVPCICGGAAGYDAGGKGAERSNGFSPSTKWESANMAFQKKASDLFRARMGVKKISK